MAAIGFQDFPPVCYVTNLFSAIGHARKGWRLGALLEERADELGLEIRCDTDPENWHFLRILLSRGYEPSLVCLRRRPRDAR